jgi:hydrogenase-4 component B
MACAVMHVWNHALFKSLLFLSAGSVVHAVGTREIDRMGALARSMPWTAGLFTLGAVAICGLPPLNGFISEFFLYSGALRGLNNPGGGVTGLASLAAPVLALIGGLACACFIKVIGCVYLGHPRSEEAAHAHESGWAMRAPMVVLAAACLFLGLLPALGAPALDSATAAWLDGVGGGAGAVPELRSLVPFGTMGIILAGIVAVLVLLGAGVAASARVRHSLRAETWGCGYVAPAPRMQYTASSIARTLVHLFAFVLRPREHAPRITGAFPRPVSYEGHVDDVTLQRIVAPFCRRCADHLERLRQWQTGRIQGYIVYVLLTTLCLLLFVIPLVQLLKRLVTE